MFKNKRVQNALAILLALALWQAASMALDIKLLLVSPIDVAVRLWELIFETEFWRSLSFSFWRIEAGFFAGFALGIGLALAAGRFRLIEVLLRPLVVTIKSVPVASFIIIALIWLSSAQLSIFISFLMVFPIIYTNVLAGIHAADGELLEMARLFALPWGRRFVYIYLPAIRPFLVSASGVALGLSWKAGVAAEVIGIPTGSIGEALYQAKVYFNTSSLFAWTVVIVAVSLLFEKLFLFALRRGFRGLERL